MELLHKGKVRDVYTDRPGEILLVASDRVSTYDVVHPTPVPDKGKILTAMSLWWFDQLAEVVPNHVVSLDVPDEVAGRAMICRQLRMYPIECVARGYITGSAMTEYQASSSVCGVPLPPGLVESEKLPEPIFTPAAKAEVGEHDENITFEETAQRVGLPVARRLRETTLAVYARAAQIAAARGILRADTKLEFGASPQPGEPDVVLGDEVLTPDSSRFWPAGAWAPGSSPPSFDKQYVRDYCETLGWDKQPPGPELPDDVVAGTRARYVEAFERLTGIRFDDYLADPDVVVA